MSEQTARRLSAGTGRAVLLFCMACWVGLPLRAQAGLADAQASIAAQQQRLGGRSGTLSLDQPARLAGDVTLAPGENLRIVAPLTVGAATVHLRGHNVITCEAPLHIANATDLFVADGATDISVRSCDVTVDGRPGGYLLTATRAQRVVATDNHLLNMALFNTHNTGGAASQTTDVSLNGNSSEFTHDGGPIGVYLLYVLRATVNSNRFRGTGHGIEWWGGDGSEGWHGAQAVTEAGDLSITGNQCFSAGGACVWGSMGFNVTVSGNSADTCSDVCFDTEGGVRNLFTGNTAQSCASGCYSVQMESEDVVFSSNYAYADAQHPALALVLIKHRNGNPAPHRNLTFTGNALTCGTLCTAFYSEGEAGLELAHNTVVNGRFVFANYDHDVHIANNSLTFHVPLGAEAALQGPAMANAQTSVIEGNTLTADVPEPRSVCIAQSWSDFNNTDEMRLTGNTCTGFGIGIFTETAGGNPGAPRAVWEVQGNHFFHVPAATQVVHRRTSGNESYPAP